MGESIRKHALAPVTFVTLFAIDRLNAAPLPSDIMKKTLPLKPIKKIQLKKETLARLDRRELTTLELDLVKGGSGDELVRLAAGPLRSRA